MSSPAVRKTIVSWSSGKDSAYALHLIRQDPTYDVVGLVTTVNAAADQVAVHGVRRTLLERQAEVLGLPLFVVELPYPCPNAIYEAKMEAYMASARTDGIEVMVFGDLFLEDIRAYRERMLEGKGIEPVFPLWGDSTQTEGLAVQMRAAGIVAHLTCVDPRQMSSTLVGRCWDEALWAELPSSVDRCGENGEFHTFVSDGPGFSAPISIEVGETVERHGFWFADVRSV